ncbi:MAG: MCP four helix bundle domain-containing protein, partial [Oscillospiraceae bacterium]
MKKAPLKILLVIIITGLFCLVGTFVFSKELRDFQEIHRSIMDEYVENREYMSKIEMMLYQHQALIVNHVLSDDETLDEAYAEEEEQLLSEITKLITDFSYRMKGGEREKLYHKVYSDFAGYAHNSSALLTYKQNGEISMAIYYNDHTLKPFLDNINKNLDALDKMTKDEINNAEAKMQRANKLSELISLVVITVIVISFMICLYFCVKITYYLDRYKIELEKELTAKNDVIRQENEKMLNVQDNIIISMANLIESRDGETGEHVKRTS